MGALGIAWKMWSDPEQEPRHAGKAVLPAHHRAEGQHFLKYLVRAAGSVVRTKFVCRIGSDDRTRRHRLRRIVLAGCLSGTNCVARPKESKNLAIAIFEQPNSTDDPLSNFNILSLVLILPKKSAASWNVGSNFATPPSQEFTLMRFRNHKLRNAAAMGR